MMSADDDPLIDAYLWDPAAPPSAPVDAIVRRIAPARFDLARRPLSLAAAPVARRRTTYGRLLAIAAVLALIAAGASALWSWRWSWSAGAPWPVSVDHASGGSAPLTPSLQVDRPLQVGADAARVTIARIGTMTLAPGTALTLAETSSVRHRVLLSRGSIEVRVWAPPGRLAFNTPAGNVVDLGCIFALSVDAAGTSRLRVDTGWVEMQNGWGESLVPAGASSAMSAEAAPGVPIYDDASPAFATAIRAVERTPDDARGLAVVARAAPAARPRDVLTLLMLAHASRMSLKRPLLERAAQLVPPPPGVSVEAILAGDPDQVWGWYAALKLPPAKNWWSNWRDALPVLR